MHPTSPVPLLPPPFLPMPRLGLGTWPMRGAECQRAVESAIALGYRHLDTTAMYGNEEAVGAGMRASGLPREAFFLTTKAWVDRSTGEAIRAACEESLRRLAQPYVDLYLIHWPSPRLDLPGALRALARIQSDGLARHVGVANFPLGLMRQAVESGIAPIACLQVEHHVMLGQKRLLDYVVPRGIALTSYTPVAKGVVTDDPAIRRVAAKHGATPAQVALAWVLAQGEHVVPIPGTKRLRYLEENVAAASVSLSPADLEELDALPAPVGARY